ncbi:MAG: alanine--tRNA ligase [Candidatus Coatesbacteria bacterium]|nr:MAG: alanine--tRNA ligase [Candidatus Coatesbacteria bacterium]
MDSKALRQSFLDFFEQRDHKIVAPAPLVPAGDPTLLFNTAGMVQFKPHFAGSVELTFKRAASCQPCLRAGGKDSDLALVGHTLRHHTLFEMLGNFSFGDYFKREAIAWGWEYLADVLKLDPERLYVTVHTDDDEAAAIWVEEVGFPAERLSRYDEDNFWGPAGGLGACGPSSEIHYYAGEEYGCGREECHVNCDCDRFLEVWNLVFPQFDQQADGTRLPLPNPGIDTGMGLERLAFAVQGVVDNFRTDLFLPIIQRTEEVLQKDYGDDGRTRSSMNIVADHVRALTFAVAENVLPSNDGRGYVVRKLLRRALLHAYLLGLQEPALHRLVEPVVAVMGGTYAHLPPQRSFVEGVLREEEEQYLATLGRGMDRLRGKLASLKKGGLLGGEDAFTLYDTYGLPLEVTAEVAEWEGVDVDAAGFEEEMTAQRHRSRAAAASADEFPLTGNVDDVPATTFVGYDDLSHEATVLAIVTAEGRVAGAQEDTRAVVVLNVSPFYAEAGGQVGDAGLLTAEGVAFDVEETTKAPQGQFLHVGVVREGILKEGQTVTAAVDRSRRQAVAGHHTATHLLHAALREVVGEGATQAGSFVGPSYLRFDYASKRALEPEEVEEVERRVQRNVVANLPVWWTDMEVEEAKSRGAMALFGEKYGERGRVVCVGGEGEELSLELCGGTHLCNTGEVGPFYLVREEALAAGVRRLEAVAGEAALAYAHKMRRVLAEAAAIIKTGWEDLPSRVQSALDDRRELDKKLRRLTSQEATAHAAELLASAAQVGPVRLVTGLLAGASADAVKEAASSLISAHGDVVALFASDEGGKATIFAGAGAEAIAAGAHAGNLVRDVAKALGGGGGGKPDFAQAGAKTAEGLEEALAQAERLLSEMIGG